jgi:hypothetical protein
MDLTALKDQILKIHQVNNVSFTISPPKRSLGVVVTTKPISMDGVILGEFEITIPPSLDVNDIQIKNLTRQIMVPELTDTKTYFHHPHIWGTSKDKPYICFGNITDRLYHAVVRKEYLLALITIITFLETGYGWSLEKKSRVLANWGDDFPIKTPVLPSKSTYPNGTKFRHTHSTVRPNHILQLLNLGKKWVLKDLTAEIEGDSRDGTYYYGPNKAIPYVEGVDEIDPTRICHTDLVLLEGEYNGTK